jgi:multiple sugar transport system ATP-binding protein
VIAGVRPEHFEDAQVEPDKPGLRFTAPVTVVESMGSELYAYFKVQSEGVESDQLAELAEDSGAAEVPGGGAEGQIVARLEPSSKVTRGQEAELWVDTEKLYFFDASTGQSLARSG